MEYHVYFIDFASEKHSAIISKVNLNFISISIEIKNNGDMQSQKGYF